MTNTPYSISRRNLLAGGATVGALGMTGLLGACSNSRGSGNAAPTASTKNDQFTSAKINWKQFQGTTLNLWVESHPWFTAIKPLLPQFEKLTGMKVKPQLLGEDQYVTKIAVTLSGGATSPDIFMINQFGQAAGSGWLEPLDKYLNNGALTDANWYANDDFFPGARAFGKAKGKTLAMPITAEAQVLFVRTDLVKKPPQTLDALTKAAAAANKGKVAGFGSRAIASPSETPWPFGGFSFTHGGMFLNANGKAVLNSSANIAALTQYSNLLSKYGPKGVSSWGFLENEQAMQQGRLALWSDSSTFLADLRNTSKSVKGSTIDAYPFPSYQGKSVPNVWYWTVGINSKSPHKEAAWLFLQWATSKPVSEGAALVGASPARTSSWHTPEASKSIGKENAARILNVLQNYKSQAYAYAWQNTKWAQIADGLARAVNSAVTGAPPAQALGKAQAQATKILG